MEDDPPDSGIGVTETVHQFGNVVEYKFIS